MNIFVLSYDPSLAALYHCDKHVGKMIVESLQMMSTALAHHDLQTPLKKDGSRYSPKSHPNHPCTKWVKESSDNFMWLYYLTLHLCDQFYIRYGKQHAGWASLHSIFNPSSPEEQVEQAVRSLCGVKTTLLKDEFMKKYPNCISLSAPGDFVLCMPDQYKSKIPEEWTQGPEAQALSEKGAPLAYRRFYRAEKAKFASWDRFPSQEQADLVHNGLFTYDENNKLVPSWWNSSSVLGYYK